ncbi:MAG: DUF4418 family protein [Firmicutes bacterium]|nr:DUF4418 family protein [Bacillota bacterium]
MISNKILGVLTIIVGALMAIGPLTFAHVCNDMSGSVPACHETRSTAIILGLIIVILGLILFIMKSRIAGKIFPIIFILAGIAGVLVPTVIAPVCKMKDMHCHMYTLPFLIADSLFLVGVSAIFALIAFKRKPKPAAEAVAEEIEVIEQTDEKSE